MIIAIEGCTCAGKTTLMRHLCALNPEAQPAPEHTPPPVQAGEDMLTRQQRVFSDYLAHYCQLREAQGLYVADYTPLGCVAFSLALYKQTHDERFMRQAIAFAGECQSAKVHCYKYLPATPALIIDRLKTRNRDTDSAWDAEFVAYLCQAYDEVFVHDIFSLNPVAVLEE